MKKKILLVASVLIAIAVVIAVALHRPTPRCDETIDVLARGSILDCSKF